MKDAYSIKEAVRLVLWRQGGPMRRADIQQGVESLLGHSVSASSITSSLRLQSQSDVSPIVNVERGIYSYDLEFHTFGKSRLYFGDSLDIIPQLPSNSIHAVVTDPPYGLVEYKDKELNKLRCGHGGVWRIPPSYDGCQRSPLPRFTTLSDTELRQMSKFFEQLGRELMRVLVPGANVLIASNPLVCHIVTNAMVTVGFEARGQVIRLVQTMRGGDRPKGSEAEFNEVSAMARSQWEPWIMLRKQLDGTTANNLRVWKTGGWRRFSDEKPFGDVIKSSPTRSEERRLAPHPSLKPQKFMREVVLASLPLGEGVVLDPFAGSGSTLAAAESMGYRAIGIERDEGYFQLACEVMPKLKALEV